MKEVKRITGVVVVALGAGVLAAWFSWPGTWGHQPLDSSPSTPVLFSRVGPCPAGSKAGVRADRLELEGRLLAARAGYDPHDAVLAVARLRQAESCFRAAGLPERAERAAASATILQARIEGDFAASRSALTIAIDGGRWELARERVHELLRMTAHVEEHPYVSWLETIAGKAAVHADLPN